MSERSYEAPLDDEGGVEGQGSGVAFTGEHGEREGGDRAFTGEHGERATDDRANESIESTGEAPLV